MSAKLGVHFEVVFCHHRQHKASGEEDGISPLSVHAAEARCDDGLRLEREAEPSRESTMLGIAARPVRTREFDASDALEGIGAVETSLAVSVVQVEIHLKTLVGWRAAYDVQS